MGAQKGKGRGVKEKDRGKKERKGKERKGKGREGKGREGKGREGKGREGKGVSLLLLDLDVPEYGVQHSSIYPPTTKGQARRKTSCKILTGTLP